MKRFFPSKWWKVLLCCVLISCLLPVTAAMAGSKTRYVCTENGGSLNVRDFPGKKGSILGRVLNGSRLRILGEEGAWSEIEYDGTQGYVMTVFLADTKPLSPNMKWTGTNQRLVVRTGNKFPLHLRRDASRSSESLGQFENGTKVQVSAVSASWAKVTVGGKKGYMMRKYLSASSEEKDPKKDSDYEEVSDTTKYIRNSVDAKLYASASSASAVQQTVPGGSAVRVYGESGSFYNVSAYGVNGFVLKSDLSSNPPVSNGSGNRGTIINPNGASYVNVRSTPKLTGEYNILGILRIDTEVDILGRKGSWIKVSYGGLTGYIHRTFLSRNQGNAE